MAVVQCCTKMGPCSSKVGNFAQNTVFPTAKTLLGITENSLPFSLIKIRMYQSLSSHMGTKQSLMLINLSQLGWWLLSKYQPGHHDEKRGGSRLS